MPRYTSAARYYGERELVAFTAEAKARLADHDAADAIADAFDQTPMPPALPAEVVDEAIEAWEEYLASSGDDLAVAEVLRVTDPFDDLAIDDLVDRHGAVSIMDLMGATEVFDPADLQWGMSIRTDHHSGTWRNGAHRC